MYLNIYLPFRLALFLPVWVNVHIVIALYYFCMMGYKRMERYLELSFQQLKITAFKILTNSFELFICIV